MMWMRANENVWMLADGKISGALDNSLTMTGTHDFGIELILCGDPVVADFPRWFRYKSGKRKPIVILVLLEIGKCDEEEAR